MRKWRIVTYRAKELFSPQCQYESQEADCSSHLQLDSTLKMKFGIAFVAICLVLGISEGGKLEQEDPATIFLYGAGFTPDMSPEQIHSRVAEIGNNIKGLLDKVIDFIRKFDGQTLRQALNNLNQRIDARVVVIEGLSRDEVPNYLVKSFQEMKEEIVEMVSKSVPVASLDGWEEFSEEVDTIIMNAVQDYMDNYEDLSDEEFKEAVTNDAENLKDEIDQTFGDVKDLRPEDVIYELDYLKDSIDATVENLRNTGYFGLKAIVNSFLPNY
ncbi:hypothetical protein PoB_007355800 [Plakobranchus ocellatus]|uniref:SXP/RAL-2 family protein Ani s 5-like cation-binding domain-containing protein n=1 Tax=Plakobranchus ocellatus TaxID=259542 RepID=A0AAV4DRV8_9GAST|nr:hypothetical protein PoB_007355800 [Plakobranchus ocellatus]